MTGRFEPPSGQGGLKRNRVVSLQAACTAGCELTIDTFLKGIYLDVWPRVCLGDTSGSCCKTLQEATQVKGGGAGRSSCKLRYSPFRTTLFPHYLPRWYQVLLSITYRNLISSDIASRYLPTSGKANHPIARRVHVASIPQSILPSCSFRGLGFLLSLQLISRLPTHT